MSRETKKYLAWLAVCALTGTGAGSLVNDNLDLDTTSGKVIGIATGLASTLVVTYVGSDICNDFGNHIVNKLSDWKTRRGAKKNEVEDLFDDFEEVSADDDEGIEVI